MIYEVKKYQRIINAENKNLEEIRKNGLKLSSSIKVDIHLK